MRRAFAVLVVALVSVFAAAPRAGAQAPPPRPDVVVGPPPVQYNFAPPGARSLAMGASFIGLADDATASESNPAGLTILTKPEFSAHLRYTQFDNTVPNTVSGEGFETFTTRVGSPSFFSVVYPWQKAAISLYYQRSADFRSGSVFDGFISRDLYNQDVVEILFRTENVGLSGAVKLGDKISVGASIRATRVRTDSLQRVILVFPVEDGFFTVRFQNDASIDSSETKTTFNAGFLITPTPKFSLGGVYKKGADFQFSQTIASVADVVFGSFPEPVERESVRITVPDVFGGGLAIRPTDHFTLVADVVQIKYSQADLGVAGRNGYQRFGQGGREPLEDATEFHGGLEYTWTSGSDWIFSMRGGYYLNPDHDGLGGVDSKQNHITFGGGVVVKNKLQVDGAVNIADSIKEGLISFVVRF